MNKRKLLLRILKTSGMLKLIYIFLVFFAATMFLLPLWEPGIKTLGDSFWFCFSSITTIGYGDLTAVTTIGRILTALLSLYGIILVAIITGILVSYITELQKIRARESVAKFIDALDHLDSMSKEELTELSNRIRKHKYKM